METHDVHLTWEEVARAAGVGIKRNIDAKKRNLEPKHGYKGHGWGIHIEGAIGEQVVAKLLGIDWVGDSMTFKTKADVGEFEIRTRSQSFMDLLVRKNDVPSRVFILVVGPIPPLWQPRYTVIGWTYGYEAMQSKYLASHGGREEAFFMPQSDLRPMALLMGNEGQ